SVNGLSEARARIRSSSNFCCELSWGVSVSSTVTNKTYAYKTQ
ncbi:hypothetical protein L917_11463, partial [Phytophthora nicotianae]